MKKISEAEKERSHKKKVIEVRNLHFGFDDSFILENLTFSVSDGDYLAIIGPNGGGKSTLLKVILGLLKPSSGKIKILGTDIDEFTDHHRIGYVPQRASQLDSTFPASVEEIVWSGRVGQQGFFGKTKKDIEAVETAMNVADVVKFKNKLIGELSGGERQRVFIARALATEPKILVLDEPVAGVDIVTQNKFYNFLRVLNEEYGLTIIFVTHDIDVVAEQASYVLCLNHGLVCHGHTKEVLEGDYLDELYGRTVKMIKHEHK